MARSRDEKGKKGPVPLERSPKFTLVFFVEDDGKHLVHAWLRSLSITKKQALGTAMREILQELGVGVCGTEFGKQLGSGLFEFRLRQKPGEVRPKLPPEEILFRVFCHAYGNQMVLLLGGYDKAEDPSRRRQSKEIDEARARLRRWKARQRKAPGRLDDM